jgi:hypothetical protein
MAYLENIMKYTGRSLSEIYLSRKNILNRPISEFDTGLLD